jgi:hypothetical protein
VGDRYWCWRRLGREEDGGESCGERLMCCLPLTFVYVLGLFSVVE